LSRANSQQSQALRGRIGGFVTHARYDSNEIAARARRGFNKKFELEVDPDGLLSETERSRRAGMARKAYFARLALASANARRRKS
jgi:hypothetical protein